MHEDSSDSVDQWRLPGSAFALFLSFSFPPPVLFLCSSFPLPFLFLSSSFPLPFLFLSSSFPLPFLFLQSIYLWLAIQTCACYLKIGMTCSCGKEERERE